MTLPDNEEWKEIYDHPNYFVSNFGNFKKKGRLLKKTIQKVKTRTGEFYYPTVWLQNKYKKGKQYMCAKVVAEHFVINQKNDMLFVYKDGDRNNIKAENLLWVSYTIHPRYHYIIKNAAQMAASKKLLPRPLSEAIERIYVSELTYKTKSILIFFLEKGQEDTFYKFFKECTYHLRVWKEMKIGSATKKDIIQDTYLEIRDIFLRGLYPNPNKTYIINDALLLGYFAKAIRNKAINFITRKGIYKRIKHINANEDTFPFLFAEKYNRWDYE